MGQAAVSLAPDRLESKLSLGRDPTCDVRIVSKQVSRRHASITRSPGGPARITDQGSRNGTRVNGWRVSAAALELGDVVRLGGWVGVVTASPSALQILGPGLLGGSTLQAVLAPLRARARSSIPVVIEGETGTGKETVARSLHHWSARKGVFTVVNCSAIPSGRIEADFFGRHSDASLDTERPGVLRSVDGGTLLLDQIQSLPLSVQARLLDACLRGMVNEPGDSVPGDVRIVIAAQDPLVNAVRDGRLHQELLAHIDIAGLTLRLPPLRKRREDIAGIFLDLLRSSSDGRRDLEVSPDLIEKLCLHTWPFNVRELVGLTRRILALYGNEVMLSEKHLPDRFTAIATDPFPSEERKT